MEKCTVQWQDTCVLSWRSALSCGNTHVCCHGEVHCPASIWFNVTMKKTKQKKNNLPKDHEVLTLLSILLAPCCCWGDALDKALLGIHIYTIVSL